MQIVGGNPYRERPLRRPMHSSEDNIKVDYKEIRYKHVNWIYLAYNRVYMQTVVST